MTYKPKRQRLRITPVLNSEDRVNANTRAGPATVLSGLPRTIRRHELRLIVPLADSTIFEMEKRGEFPHRFNLSPKLRGLGFGGRRSLTRGSPKRAF
jgi:prophage regulatory protein